MGSLQYSPIFKSHCCAFGDACEDAGYSVKYVFSQVYEWMLPAKTKDRTIFLGHSRTIPTLVKDSISLANRIRIQKIFKEEKPTHFYLLNYHPLNHYIANLAKQYNCTFIYHVHEPYVTNKKLHGGLMQYWLYLFEYLQSRLLTKTDVAVISSKIASRLFESNHRSFPGRKLFVPLLYEDLPGPGPDTGERKYITFVGPPLPNKNPEKFVEMVDHSNRNGLGLNFLMISRASVDDKSYRKRENLDIVDRQDISDDEFGEMLRKSIAVVTPYRRITQSSVILVSYMYGTPVLSSNAGGLPEFVLHKKTGYLLDLDAEAHDWIAGALFIREHFPNLSANCRKYFEDNFSGKNWAKYLPALIGGHYPAWQKERLAPWPASE